MNGLRADSIIASLAEEIGISPVPEYDYTVPMDKWERSELTPGTPLWSYKGDECYMIQGDPVQKVALMFPREGLMVERTSSELILRTTILYNSIIRPRRALSAADIEFMSGLIKDAQEGTVDRVIPSCHIRLYHVTSPTLTCLWIEIEPSLRRPSRLASIFRSLFGRALNGANTGVN